MVAAVMALRPATMADARLLLTWANDPDVRAASFNSEPIGADAHWIWLRDRLPAGGFYVALEYGVFPIGYARVERTGELSVSVDATKRGRGLGRALIAAAAERATEELELAEVWARVKTENEASLVAFAAAGFVADGDGRFVWRP